MCSVHHEHTECRVFVVGFIARHSHQRDTKHVDATYSALFDVPKYTRNTRSTKNTSTQRNMRILWVLVLRKIGDGGLFNRIWV